MPGTLDAYLLDAEGKVKHKISVRTQRLVDIAGEKGVRFLVGVKTGNITKKPVNLKVLSFKEQGGEMESVGV